MICSVFFNVVVVVRVVGLLIVRLGLQNGSDGEDQDVLGTNMIIISIMITVSTGFLAFGTTKNQATDPVVGPEIAATTTIITAMIALVGSLKVEP